MAPLDGFEPPLSLRHLQGSRPCNFTIRLEGYKRRFYSPKLLSITYWRISSIWVGKPYVLHHFLMADSDTPYFLPIAEKPSFATIIAKASLSGRSTVLRVSEKHLWQRWFLLSSLIGIPHFSQTRFNLCWGFGFWVEDDFFKFLPAKVSVWEWQLGQRKRRFSNLLSKWSPFIWSTWRTNGFPFYSPVFPQIAHLYSIRLYFLSFSRVPLPLLFTPLTK